VTAPLPQFTLQFSAYIIILYMLETLKVRVKVKVKHRKVRLKATIILFLG
jgi:HJR/Mrr/RecB family endonuclease